MSLTRSTKCTLKRLLGLGLLINLKHLLTCFEASLLDMLVSSYLFVDLVNLEFEANTVQLKQLSRFVIEKASYLDKIVNERRRTKTSFE